jgi:hypothetical protein
MEIIGGKYFQMIEEIIPSLLRIVIFLKSTRFILMCWLGTFPCSNNFQTAFGTVYIVHCTLECGYFPHVNSPGGYQIVDVFTPQCKLLTLNSWPAFSAFSGKIAFKKIIFCLQLHHRTESRDFNLPFFTQILLSPQSMLWKIAPVRFCYVHRNLLNDSPRSKKRFPVMITHIGEFWLRNDDCIGVSWLPTVNRRIQQGILPPGVFGIIVRIGLQKDTCWCQIHKRVRTLECVKGTVRRKPRWVKIGINR